MILFWLGLVSLFIFSILDLKTKSLSNKYILILFLIGLAYHIFIGDLASTGLGMALIAIFGYTMWYFKLIGGGDAKLLPVVVMFLPFHGVPNLLAVLLYFILEFGIIGSLYGFIYRILYKKEEYIPFIPAITLAYCLSWFFRIN